MIGARGRVITWCRECRKAYRGGGRPRRASRRIGLDASAALRVLVVESSGNRKLRGLLVTLSSASTCPPSCGFYGAGCYAEFHLSKRTWTQVPDRGLPWARFVERVARFEPGRLWRHNEAGDLPGRGERLDVDALLELALANRQARARGFTFTHKPLRTERERRAVAAANRLGFTVNLSADGLERADELAELGIGPVAVVLPADAPTRGLRTPGGRPVAVCPAQTRDLTCAECGVCARPLRAGIVGFLAHGQARGDVSERVRLPVVG